MAILDIGPITIPTADFVDVQAALQQKYANNGTPNPTNAQVLEAMRQEVISMIRSVTKQYRLANAAIVDPVVS